MTADEIPAAFYTASGNADLTYLATAYTSGPWDPNAQHGGPPAALLVGAIERAAQQANSALAIVRATIDLLRPVPVGRVDIDLEAVRQGRRVSEWRGGLSVDGKVCLRASVLLMAELDLPTPRPSGPSLLPGVQSCPPYAFPFFRQPIGYHSAVEVRWAKSTWGSPPAGAWLRPRFPLVLGQASLPIERTLLVADAANGIGAALPLDRFTFLNADLTVSIFRPVRGEWVGLLVDTALPHRGIGQTHAQIEDESGPCGYGIQSLVLANL